MPQQWSPTMQPMIPHSTGDSRERSSPSGHQERSRPDKSMMRCRTGVGRRSGSLLGPRHILSNSYIRRALPSPPGQTDRHNQRRCRPHVGRIPVSRLDTTSPRVKRTAWQQKLQRRAKQGFHSPEPAASGSCPILPHFDIISRLFNLLSTSSSWAPHREESWCRKRNAFYR